MPAPPAGGLIDMIRRKVPAALAGAWAEPGRGAHADEEGLVAPRSPQPPRKAPTSPPTGAGPPPGHPQQGAFVCASCGCSCACWRADAAARCRPGVAWAMLTIFVILPAVRNFGMLPNFVLRALGVAGLAALAHRMAVFRRWGDEHRYVGRFFVVFLIMIAELLFENCMVWIVSYTDKRKYEDVPGLQDNGEIFFAALAARGGALGRWALYGDWVHTLEFMGAALVVAFSVAFDQIPYSGFGVMTRYCLTITLGRLMRVASFLTTVLPNPRPGCYARRFPPPPDTAWEALRVGFVTLRGTGGCNDLIFSGHGAFWTLTPCLLASYYPSPRHGRWVFWLVAVALFQTAVRDFLEHWHYSVDQLLAVVVTAAVWGWLRCVYPESRPLPRRPEGAPPDPPNRLVVALAWFGLATGAFILVVAGA